MDVYNNVANWKWVVFLLTLSTYAISEPVRTYEKHDRCIRSPDRMVPSSVKEAAVLEVMEPNSKHGDVCRNLITSGFFCPLGCSKINIQPFCKETIKAKVIRPCRLSKFEIPITKSKPSSKNKSLLSGISSKLNSTYTKQNSTKNGEIIKTNHSSSQLVRAPMSTRGKDWLFGFGAEMTRAADNNVSGTETVKCDFTPLLLPLKPSTCSARVITQRNNLYTKRVDENRVNAMKDVSMTPLYGRVKLRIGGRDKWMQWINDDMIYSAAWNDTHTIQGTHRIDSESDIVMGWRELTNEQRTSCSRCDHVVTQKGPVYVVANSWPGHYGHFIHDTISLLFWLRMFRVPGDAYFAIVVHSLHRKVFEWLDPKLSSRIIWLFPGNTYCFVKREFPVVAVQIAKLDTDGSVFIIKKARVSDLFLSLYNQQFSLLYCY